MKSAFALLFISAAAWAGPYEQAQTDYASVRARLDGSLAKIQADREAATAPVDAEIAARERLRETCVTFECAVKIGEELRALSARRGRLIAPYEAQAEAETSAAAKRGREIAVAAYAQEAEAFVRATTDATILRVQHGLPCTGGAGLPAPSIGATCLAATFDYRRGNDFYRHEVAFGMQAHGAPARVDLSASDALFQSTSREFLGRDSAVAFYLRAMLGEQPVSCDAGLSHEAGQPYYHFSFTRVGFHTIRLEKAPPP